MKDATINTIMTLVVRMKETVVLKSNDGAAHRYIEWSNVFAEPQLIIPSMGANPVKMGIAGCVLHLAELPDDTAYYVYKPQVDTRA